jgi:hypothetical protein
MTNSPESDLVPRPFPGRCRLFLTLLVALALLLTGHSASAESRSAWTRIVWSNVVSRLINLFAPDSSIAWRDVPADERARVLGALKTRRDTEYRAILDRLSDLRAQELPFYPDAVLYEGRIENGSGFYDRFAFIRHPQGFTVLTGEAEPIYALNASAPLRLDTEPRAQAYLHFFSYALETSEGDTFTIVEQWDDLPWRSSPSSAPDRSDVEEPLRHYYSGFGVDQKMSPAVERIQRSFWVDERKLKPLALRRDDDNLWRAEGTILHRNILYDIQFKIAPDGQVKMLFDQQQSAELPVQSPRFAEVVRRARQPTQPQPSGSDHHERTRL